jgi:hypothetical protein
VRLCRTPPSLDWEGSNISILNDFSNTEKKVYLGINIGFMIAKKLFSNLLALIV